MNIKQFIFFTLSLLPILVYAQEEKDFEHHCLFEHKSLTLGVAAPFSFALNSTGINVRMYHNITENICFGPEVSYAKNKDTEIVDFDFVVHYIFETPIVGVYPLLGVNYTVEKRTHLQEEEAQAKSGIVYGFGVHRNIKNATLFMEYSRVELGFLDQFLTLGLMYSF